ncbi:type I-E CRISPR-associated protein Cse1/CasA [Thiohalocapsa halophila]|uniref:Type I-E CRISPR-associated protein Cse1/CasA n=1 Tax=Thiohalocapsa halophila TaxID=69359 RepID=A0ABS1CM04_9GAMM|nr:type I-E CRISPR-associated protein Cse1/CasA [Thiohalocapsa halophila]MBK1632955.1 type I-E CRISPR-associated protein Cse1/CasA [Thiohalocapsa halophila]
MTLLHSLLDDPLIRVRQRADGAHGQLTLPELFVAFAADEVRDFPALRPHQRHPWHAFLVQLAAIALHHQGVDQPMVSAAQWRDALLDLTPQQPDGAAWCLISPIDQPAFLQPPVPEGSLAGWKSDQATPDAMDLLVTSKNHELKQERMAVAAPDDWIFSLVSLQTAGPYPGSGNHGVARMNGGSSSRPGVGVSPPGGVGARWARDLTIALASRDAIAKTHGYRVDGGVGLLWLLAWDGKSELSLGNLDPLFIEVCRRIRLREQNGQLLLLRTSSEKQRIAKAETGKKHGNTGDLWTPVSKVGAKSLGVSATGFNYKRMCELAFPTAWQAPPAQQLQPSDDREGLRLVARAIAGGNSKTDGYHERQVPLRSNMRRLLVRGDIGLLERVASERVDAVGRIHQQLHSALEVLLDNGKERPRKDLPDSLRNKARTFAKEFERAEDLIFFDALSEEIEAAPEAREAIRLRWLLDMADRARRVLEQAFSAGPRSAEPRYRARAAARSRLEGGLRSTKILPALAEHYRQERLSKENNDDGNRDRAEP